MNEKLLTIYLSETEVSNLRYALTMAITEETDRALNLPYSDKTRWVLRDELVKLLDTLYAQTEHYSQLDK